MDIQTASLEDLKIARNDINARIKELEHQAIEELEGRAAQLGFKLIRPNGIPEPQKPTIKYRDQQGNTWSGRGRKPAWVNAIIDAGGDIEEYRT